MQQRRRAFSTNWGDSGGVVSTRWSKGENFGICRWLSRQHCGNSAERGPVDRHYCGWFRKHGKTAPQDKKGQLIRVARFCKCHQAEVSNIPSVSIFQRDSESDTIKACRGAVWRWDCESIIEATTTWCKKYIWNRNLGFTNRWHCRLCLSFILNALDRSGLIIFHAMRSVGLD